MTIDREGSGVRGIVMLVLLWALGCGVAGAASIESLVMPGPVIEGHAKLEEQCSKCHAPFTKIRQSDLCLDCHEEVAADVKGREGYHGRIKNVDQRECKSCHTEHKGRDMDIVRLDRDTFAHDATDFALKGLHAKARCDGCHKAGEPFRKAPSACIDCHRTDDVHKGKLGERCVNCHSEKGWRQTRFDHSKTDYPLTGKHVDVACDSCHPSQRYKGIPTDCNACHKWNDPHRSRFGAKCDTCHVVDGWKQLRFDHGRDTKFALTGAHRKTACETCHKGDLYRDKLETNCYACHRLEDRHQGRNGRKCQSCHTTERWADLTFDHNRNTDFALRGRHEKVPCQDCHRGELHREKLETECYACHRKDDVHKEQQGRQCGKCHNEKGWAGEVRFEHDVTRFPLIGAHAITPCEECHTSAAYKDAELECVACHRKDDKHERRLGDACGQCHNPNGWRIWEFDHNTRTDFRLDGRHEGLDCLACHREPVGKKFDLPKTCKGCHDRDDVHNGNFGARCEQCHVTSSFREIEMGR